MTIYNYNLLKPLLSSMNPDEAFRYDADGNMTQGYTYQGYPFTAAYDAENRLTSIQFADAGGVVHKTEYFYRGDGMLAEVKKFTIIDDIRIIRAGSLPLQERDMSNSVTREYTWDMHSPGGIGGLLAMRQGGNDFYFHYNGRGDVAAVTDDTGNTVARYRDDEFGNLLAGTGSLNQPFRFSTKRFDADNGIYYYGRRFYSPALGRWLTCDPIGEAGGMNLYGFVGNDPVNRVEMWGQWQEDVHSGIGNLNETRAEQCRDCMFTSPSSQPA